MIIGAYLLVSQPILLTILNVYSGKGHFGKLVVVLD